MMTEENVLTDENYKEKTSGVSGVAVFHKKACPNCRALNKMLAKFFAANPEIVQWSVDSETNPEVMKTLGVERVPTMVIIKNGKFMEKKVGLLNIREMSAFCKSL